MFIINSAMTQLSAISHGRLLITRDDWQISDNGPRVHDNGMMIPPEMTRIDNKDKY